MEGGTEEERYYKEEHVDNNTFTGDEEGGWREREDCDGGRGSFIEGEGVRVVVVRITNGRVSDWKGAVRDWSLEGEENVAGENGEGARLVNGVTP